MTSARVLGAQQSYMSQVPYNLIFTIDCRWSSYFDLQKVHFEAKIDILLTLMLIQFSIPDIFRTTLMGISKKVQDSIYF